MLQYRAQIDVLRKTLVTAETMARIVAPYATRPSPSPCPMMATMKLDLPHPESLSSQLLSIGVDKASADRISTAMMRASLKLKGVCEADFDRRRQGPRAQYFDDAPSLSRISATYASIFKTTTQNWKTYIVENFVPRYLKAQAHHHGSSSRPKRPFNQGALPLLEEYFSCNAFPSRLEKFELAEKSNMEYRQIHVWFQNRRSRFRKEGRELRRPGSNGALSDELENSVVEALLPVEFDEGEHWDQRKSGGSLPIRPSSQASPCPFFKTEAPIHAFPAPYPPLCQGDPFPATAEKRALQMPWIRSPTTCRNEPYAVDVAALTESFAKLSLAEHHEDASYPRNRSSRSSPLSLYLGFLTPCARAPHPSLIRRLKVATHPDCTAMAPTCSHQPSAFSRSPSLAPTQLPCANRSALLPVKRCGLTSGQQSPIASGKLSRRVKRSLPRRMPRNPPATRAEKSSDMRLLSGVQPPSRTSSTSSLPSRSGSESDTTETSLTTPPHQCNSLPTFGFPSVFTFDDVVCERPGRQTSLGLDLPLHLPQFDTLREVCPVTHSAYDKLKAEGPISFVCSSL
nr:homeodomain HD2 [Ganoderma boninense]